MPIAHYRFCWRSKFCICFFTYFISISWITCFPKVIILYFKFYPNREETRRGNIALELGKKGKEDAKIELSKKRGSNRHAEIKIETADQGKLNAKIALTEKNIEMECGDAKVQINNKKEPYGFNKKQCKMDPASRSK